MRLATVFDSEYNEPRPVFELPAGERIDLRELLRQRADAQTAQTAQNALSEIPLYFTDLAKTIQHWDDVVAAARAWATQRSDAAEKDPSKLPEPSRMTRMAFCPPIPQPRTFRAFDTFEQHVKTIHAKRSQPMPQAWYDEPMFRFANTGSLVGHCAGVSAPRGSQELDFELSLAVVVGRGGRDINDADAWKHVAGFTIVNDLVARDIERHELTIGSGAGRSRGFGSAVGPYLVTIDALRDKIDSHGRIHLNMTARVNGKEIARGNAASMYFSWPAVIEQASRDADLYPGDIISAGAIGGGSLLEAGRDTLEGRWLEPGDVVELEIERLGVLRTPIVASPGMRGRQDRPTLATAAGM